MTVIQRDCPFASVCIWETVIVFQGDGGAGCMCSPYDAFGIMHGKVETVWF